MGKGGGESRARADTLRLDLARLPESVRDPLSAFTLHLLPRCEGNLDHIYSGLSRES